MADDTGRIEFDLSGIDWNDDDAIRAAADHIWRIATRQWGQADEQPAIRDGQEEES
jgi:hypothetical protein